MTEHEYVGSGISAAKDWTKVLDQGKIWLEHFSALEDDAVEGSVLFSTAKTRKDKSMMTPRAAVLVAFLKMIRGGRIAPDVSGVQFRVGRVGLNIPGPTSSCVGLHFLIPGGERLVLHPEP